MDIFLVDGYFSLHVLLINIWILTADVSGKQMHHVNMSFFDCSFAYCHERHLLKQINKHKLITTVFEMKWVSAMSQSSFLENHCVLVVSWKTMVCISVLVIIPQQDWMYICYAWSYNIVNWTWSDQKIYIGGRVFCASQDTHVIFTSSMHLQYFKFQIPVGTQNASCLHSNCVKVFISSTTLLIYCLEWYHQEIRLQLYSFHQNVTTNNRTFWPVHLFVGCPVVSFSCTFTFDLKLVRQHR